MTQLVSDSQAFPVTPPTNLDDAKEVVSNDWSAFASVRRMTNHWNRPGWSPGHRAYYWMLTFPDTDALINEARHCQHRIATFPMDAVPADGLHITMNKIGNCRGLDIDTLDQLAIRARLAVGRSFTLLAHPMAGSPGAVRFSLSPWTPLVRLHAALAAVGRDVNVPGGKSTRLFRPHLGIAYSNKSQPAAPVIEAVRQLRTRAPVPVPVRSINVIELRREGAVYRWDTLHRIPLQGPTSNG